MILIVPNFDLIIRASKSLNPKELMELLQYNISRFYSWGAKSFTIDNKNDCRMFRMTVNGILHKGFIYIFLNGNDLFDVYLTTKEDIIKKIQTDLYFDMLVNWIDNNIEKIPEYKF